MTAPDHKCPCISCRPAGNDLQAWTAPGWDEIAKRRPLPPARLVAHPLARVGAWVRLALAPFEYFTDALREGDPVAWIVVAATVTALELL